MIIKGFNLLELFFGSGGFHLRLILNILLKSLIIILFQLLINLLLNKRIMFLGFDGSIIKAIELIPINIEFIECSHALIHGYILKFNIFLHSFDFIKCLRKCLEIYVLHFL